MGLGSGPGRQLVFIGTQTLGGLLFGGCGLTRHIRDPWRVAVLPLWIAEQMPDEALSEPDYCAHLVATLELVGARGKPVRKRRRPWPQFVGYRVALKLLERGRVAWGQFAFRQDLARWLRRHPAPGAAEVRLEPSELLAAMRAAGCPICDSRAPRTGQQQPLTGGGS